MNFLQIVRTSLERVAENIMTCLWCGVWVKMPWTSRRMSVESGKRTFTSVLRVSMLDHKGKEVKKRSKCGSERVDVAGLQASSRSLFFSASRSDIKPCRLNNLSLCAGDRLSGARISGQYCLPDRHTDTDMPPAFPCPEQPLGRLLRCRDCVVCRSGST